MLSGVIGSSSDDSMLNKRVEGIIMIIKHCLAVVAGVSLFINTASAATLILQAATGHPHLGSGTHVWQNEFSDTHLLITDGRTISMPDSFSGLESSQTRVWDTPIPLPSTNQNWNAIAFGAAAGFASSTLTNRICAFNSAGAFTGCGASVAPGATSTTFVQTDGSAYSQSTLFRRCQSTPIQGCSEVKLIQIKAFN